MPRRTQAPKTPTSKTCKQMGVTDLRLRHPTAQSEPRAGVRAAPKNLSRLRKFFAHLQENRIGRRPPQFAGDSCQSSRKRARFVMQEYETIVTCGLFFAHQLTS
jgi:hypothetical protein